MSGAGKTIRIYLADGVPSGILVAEIMNWTGKVVVAPRSALSDLMGRPEVKRTGVYVLVGADPENPSRERVYIGEGDEVKKRLLSHNSDDGKDFWTRTVVVTSKDENLTKAHIRYLESRLIQLVLPVLGFTFTRSKSASVSSHEEDGKLASSPLFIMKAVGVEATAREVDGEFIVLKGSTARKDGIAGWVTYRNLRDDLMAAGKLISNQSEGILLFAEDVPFPSPSAAASVIYAGNQNGRVAWRLKDGGATYKEWQERKLKAADAAIATR